MNREEVGFNQVVDVPLPLEATRQRVDLGKRAHLITISSNTSGTVSTYGVEAYEEVRDGILHAYMDDRVDAVVIRGEGGSFGAGGDLKQFLATLEGPRPETIVSVDHEYARMPFRAALRCPKTVVTAVDGLCIGGGLGLVLVSDVVLATGRSTFAAPEARVGMYEPFLMELLPPVVGLTRARHLVVTGESVDAETAERWGIVTCLVDDAPQLEHQLDAVLERVSRGSPTARALYKRGMTSRIPDTDVLDNFRIAMGENGLEGLRAFRDKRRPEWHPPSTDAIG